MKFDMKMVDHFDDEVEGVAEYSKLSMESKDEPELKKMFYEMAAAELDHAKKIQTLILKSMDEPMDPDLAVKFFEDFKKHLMEDMSDKYAKAKATLDTAK